MSTLTVKVAGGELWVLIADSGCTASTRDRTATGSGSGLL